MKTAQYKLGYRLFPHSKAMDKVKLKRYLKTYKDLVVSLVILFFSLVGIVFGVLPAAKKTLSFMQELRGFSEEIVSLKQKAQVLDSLGEETLRQQFALLISAIPADKSLPTIMSTTEGISRQTSVSLVDMSISAVGPVATDAGALPSGLERQIGSRLVSFSATIEGSTYAIQQFISLTPQVRRLLHIRSFSINFSKGDQPVSVKLDVYAFYSPFPTTLGSAAKSITVLTEKEEEVINQLTQFPLVAEPVVSALPPPSVGGTPRENPFSP